MRSAQEESGSMSFFSQLLEAKYSAVGRQKCITDKTVLDHLMEIAKKSYIPTGAGPVARIYDVEVFVHKKMPEGHMILVACDMDTDLAVEIYLQQLKDKE